MAVTKQGAKATSDPWRDYYMTPEYILTRVEMVLGMFYFDPAPANPQWNALAMDWIENAYINCPFSQIAEWVEHGLMQPGPQIWICHSNTEQSYYQKLVGASQAMCLVNHRIRFIHPITKLPAAKPRQGQTLFYRGPNVSTFKNVFGEIGKVLTI